MVNITAEYPGQKTGRLLIKSPFQLILNGTNIDDTLTDATGSFQTLKVSGRSMPNFDLNTKDIANRDGQMYLSKHLTPREIKVTAFIEDIDNVSLLNRLSRISKLLRSEILTIKFSDDINYKFYGTLANLEVSEDVYYQGEVVLTFICSDPFKYRDSTTLTITNSQVLSLNTMFPVSPVLDLTFGSAVTEFTIQNAQTTQVVRYKKLTGTTDTTFKVDMLNGTLTSTVNKYDQLSGLVLTSDWEDFKVDNAQQLVITPSPTTIKLTYEGVYL